MKIILTVLSLLVSCHLLAYPATAETTDQKIDGLSRELGMLSGNLDRELNLLSKQIALLLNEMSTVRSSVEVQQRNLEPVLQVLKDLQKSIEKNSHEKATQKSAEPITP